MTRRMKALQVTAHGPAGSLKPVDLPRAPLPEGHVRVRVEAAGVNPSDVLSAEGRFPHAVLPRVLGRDFAGEVIEGPRELVGTKVWGTGGDLGITRNGTHTEEIVLPAAGVSRRPSNLTAEQAASAGVPFSTAWSCLVDAAHLRDGETVVVAGAAGAVGWAAMELVAALGGKVVALVKDAKEPERIDRSRVVGIARSDAGDLPAVVRDATGGRGAEVALNGVGAPVFRPLLESLAPGGRLCVYSAAAGREVSLDLFDLYRRRLSLFGINTVVLAAEEGARILDHLRPLFEAGQLRPHPRLELYSLDQAAKAYEQVSRGPAGKVVLVPRHGGS
ncbi:MAG TPA: zinc-binding alcohol dehydrogenase family protein [Myxococcaceae bacterium]|jgi:NADPH:quinone reductase-like Zn-dependent oxidoreductase